MAGALCAPVRPTSNKADIRCADATGAMLVIDKIVLRIPNVIGVPSLDWTREGTRRQGSWARTSKGLDAGAVSIDVAKAKAGYDVKIETNLAKLLLGHNVRPMSIGELRFAVETLETEVRMALDGGILPEASTWQVVSAELLHDWEVECPSAYVVEVYRVAEQRRGHRRYIFTSAGPGNGQTFAFGPKTTGGGRLYDKEAEVEAQLRGRAGRSISTDLAEEMRRLARGRLRFELVVGSKALGAKLGTRTPTLGRLLDDLGEDPFGLVAVEWRSLVRRWEPTEYRSAIARLRGRYPAARAQRLMDAWVHLSRVGEEQYRSLFEVNRSTWSRLATDLREAGLQSGSMKSLERLEIFRPAEE